MTRPRVGVVVLLLLLLLLQYYSYIHSGFSHSGSGSRRKAAKFLDKVSESDAWEDRLEAVLQVGKSQREVLKQIVDLIRDHASKHLERHPCFSPVDLFWHHASEQVPY